MSNHNTAIEWTHIPGYKGETWNPVRGCRRVSEGCQNCYAELMAARFSGEGQPYESLAKMTPAGPRWTGKGMVVDHHLDDPLRWQKPRAVFVNSMSDLFFESFSFETIAGIFGVMAAAKDHVFMVLTKRPKRMVEFFDWLEGQVDGSGQPVSAVLKAYAMFDFGEEFGAKDVWKGKGAKSWPADYYENFEWPAPNIWLGVSVENQAAANKRIPLLLQTPAAVRFLSCEPLLGSLEIDHFLDDPVGRACCGACHPHSCNCPLDRWPQDSDGLYRTVDWVIAGGESGPNSRPMHPDWVRQLRDQCEAAGTAFFFKQWGAFRPHQLHTFRNSRRANEILSVTNTEGRGSHLAIPADADDDAGVAWRMERVGKKAAGRELDGRTHDEFPGVQS